MSRVHYSRLIAPTLAAERVEAAVAVLAVAFDKLHFDELSNRQRRKRHGSIAPARLPDHADGLRNTTII